MNKSIFLSKTFYLGALTALLPIWPSAQVWFASNMEMVGGVLGGLIIVLRLVTKTPATVTGE